MAIGQLASASWPYASWRPRPDGPTLPHLPAAPQPAAQQPLTHQPLAHQALVNQAAVHQTSQQASGSAGSVPPASMGLPAAVAPPLQDDSTGTGGAHTLQAVASPPGAVGNVITKPLESGKPASAAAPSCAVFSPVSGVTGARQD